MTMKKPIKEIDYQYLGLEVEEDLEFANEKELHDKSNTIIVGVAASILLRAGYTNVYCDVLGSMKAWQVRGFPIVRE